MIHKSEFDPLEDYENSEGVVEMTLDTKQCAEVALYMHEQWQAAPSQKFMYRTFDEWLRMLIEKA